VASANPTAGLTDTDILIDAFHNVPQALAFLAGQQGAGGVAMSIISAMELVAGCRNALELSHLQRFRQTITVWPVSGAASQDAFHLMGSFLLSYGLLIADALIAATALEQGLTLYTRNVRHFQMIPGLVLVQPY